MNITPIQADFSVGEVAPDVQYRSTLAARNRGVGTLENFVPDSRGPVLRRKGFRFLGKIGDPEFVFGCACDYIIDHNPYINSDGAGLLWSEYLGKVIVYGGRAIAGTNESRSFGLIAADNSITWYEDPDWFSPAANYYFPFSDCRLYSSVGSVTDKRYAWGKGSCSDSGNAQQFLYDLALVESLGLSGARLQLGQPDNIISPDILWQIAGESAEKLFLIPENSTSVKPNIIKKVPAAYSGTGCFQKLFYTTWNDAPGTHYWRQGFNSGCWADANTFFVLAENIATGFLESFLIADDGASYTGPIDTSGIEANALCRESTHIGDYIYTLNGGFNSTGQILKWSPDGTFIKSTPFPTGFFMYADEDAHGVPWNYYAPENALFGLVTDYGVGNTGSYLYKYNLADDTLDLCFLDRADRDNVNYAQHDWKQGGIYVAGNYYVYDPEAIRDPAGDNEPGKMVGYITPEECPG